MLHLFLVAALPLFVQEPQGSELRFHRVHLKNGNFIDGQITAETPQRVTLRLASGEMIIRRDQIDRVESIKMRSLREEPAKREQPRESPRVRPATINYAPSPGVKIAVDALLDELRKSDVVLRHQVVEKLARLDPEAGAYLASILERFEESLLPHVTSAILQLKDPRVESILAAQLSSRNPDVKIQALSILGNSNKAEFAPQIHPLLQAPEAGVRAAAVSALHALGARESFDAMVPVLGDSDREVRTRAITTLTHLARKNQREGDLVDLIASRLERAEGAARMDFIGALGQSGHREARKPLERLLKEGSVELRRAAADALTTLAMPESADALLRQIEQEREGTVRIPLAAAAEKLRLTQSVEPMISWLSDPSQEVRSAAHHALTLITGQQFGPDVQQWNGWWATRK